MVRPATHVIKRFPEHELTIERLLRKSESFRSMCDDYAVGIEALRRWERVEALRRSQRPTDPRRAVRITELRDSLAELEEEMLEVLEREVASRPGQRRRADGP